MGTTGNKVYVVIETLKDGVLKFQGAFHDSGVAMERMRNVPETREQRDVKVWAWDIEDSVNVYSPDIGEILY